MSIDTAAELACAKSVCVRVAKELQRVEPAMIEAIYKAGFADGVLHGCTSAQKALEDSWNEGTALVKRDQEKPEWLRNLMTGGRDIPNGQ